MTMITTLITMTMNNSDQTITATRMHTNNIINFGKFNYSNDGYDDCNAGSDSEDDDDDDG